MLNFEFYNPTRIIFGKGAHKKIGALLKPCAKKVLLHYGGGSIKKYGLYDSVTSSLKESGIDFIELDGVAPNPRLSKVYQGIALCKKENVDLILAVGGGSVIDSAKAIAAGVCFNGDVWDFFEFHKPITSALPIAAILTIPASGSESSASCVLTNEEEQLKLTCGSALLRPLLSVINPELFFTLPKNQIAYGVADMMSHIFERYFTATLYTDLTDSLCEATLKTIIKNAPLVYKNPQDYDAWCQIGFGGTVAHNDLLGLGRAQDWACHNMEHELSAYYDIPHGAGLAVLTPFWMRYVYKENLSMFARFAVNVMGVRGNDCYPNGVIMDGIRLLREFFDKLELPATLSELGIDESNLELMAKKSTGKISGGENPIGGLKKLYWQDVLEIYKLAK
jgi:alcohol dehydrogenase YqhD (iron-dependent ADH family)